MFGLHNTHTNATCKEHSNSKYNCDNINSDNDTAQIKRRKITIISVNIKSFRDVTWTIWQNYDDTFCFPPVNSCNCQKFGIRIDYFLSQLVNSMAGIVVLMVRREIALRFHISGSIGFNRIKRGVRLVETSCCCCYCSIVTLDYRLRQCDWNCQDTKRKIKINVSLTFRYSTLF